MRFKFLDELILTFSNYTITNVDFKTHPQQVVDWLDLHLTVFIIVLFSLFSVLILELLSQNKICLENVLKRNKSAMYALLEIVCYEGGLYLLRMSKVFEGKRERLLC